MLLKIYEGILLKIPLDFHEENPDIPLGTPPGNPLRILPDFFSEILQQISPRIAMKNFLGIPLVITPGFFWELNKKYFGNSSKDSTGIFFENSSYVEFFQGLKSDPLRNSSENCLSQTGSRRTSPIRIICIGKKV